MQNKVLIANRGEIAVRIIRACKELGIPCVAIYSKADQDSLHVKFADDAICVGGAKNCDSYLNMNNIISAAISTGCNAIHPGYGFLSENVKFVEIIERCKLKFIGPNSETISKLGNKLMAKEIAKQAKIPIIEGSDGILENVKQGLNICSKIGYPVLIKAVNGGGGKGIFLVNNEFEFTKAYETASMEAVANFGDKSLYLEKCIESPHHIEVQILGDSDGNVVYLGERDCSAQRRNQKLIEESPSPFLNDSLRKTLGNAAVRLAKLVKYEGAGTVEFMVDKQGNYYFLEMNPRIQVEHPVTELVTGVDIVKEQLKIAFGQNLKYKQSDIKINGHAIECRINAEDPLNNFWPCPGVIKNLVLPGGNGVRVDSHIYSSYVVPPYYDSLLAKLIVHGNTRKEAIKKMRCALEEFVIDGVKDNVEFLYIIMHNADFVKGQYDISLIKNILDYNENQKMIKMLNENKG
ncbi:MAG: acetyl-CoA carboxylase biotin carboxylase subunit [Clostridia bacterium]|jgi:acetyl-CoA carboxylase biotin carboxylase subunit|nr:acetyl-CoA carboxylase biotin carboxylase subunit [Clostridia bacterium]MDD3862340.1 acetyl-CoA carboxylase biotin carboxylase subunit [Clostridia bacterium]MDD4408902.1 acetyl-CoA carboxylase biotin carboxylase subunit [Clostridia bacterium]